MCIRDSWTPARHRQRKFKTRSELVACLAGNPAHWCSRLHTKLAGVVAEYGARGRLTGPRYRWRADLAVTVATVAAMAKTFWTSGDQCVWTNGVLCRHDRCIGRR